MSTREEKMEAFGRLLDVMDRLRAECPWDQEQTLESLRPNTIEEVHELSDAIIAGNLNELKKELGDVLLHIVFYSKIAQEQNAFDVADVCHSLCDKLIYRHPHIYAQVQADTAEAVVSNWEQLKQKEQGGNKSVLSGVPSSLPALIKAYRIQDKARAVGFDWERPDDAWTKVEEELAELRQALEQKDTVASEQELGDFIFSIVNTARLYQINPDNALELTNQKFMRRFNFIEAKAKAAGRELKEMTLEEMDDLWNEAKALEA